MQIVACPLAIQGSGQLRFFYSGGSACATFAEGSLDVADLKKARIGSWRRS
jgi:hypothetical protein